MTYGFNNDKSKADLSDYAKLANVVLKGDIAIVTFIYENVQPQV